MMLEPECRGRSDDLLDHERKLMGHAWVMRLQSCISLAGEQDHQLLRFRNT